MNIVVKYYTRSGNTKKLADAIAGALSLEASDISQPLSEKADLLFLGSSYYAFDVDENIKTFITENKDKIGKIAVFGTSAIMGSTRKKVKKIADPCGVSVVEEEFHCFGSFGAAHKGHPDEKDRKAAAEFAKKVCEKL